MSTHPEGQSRSNIGRVLVLDDPPTWLPVFYVPSLVVLPTIVGKIGSASLLKVGVVLTGGFVLAGG
jgi:hypothetical protein